MIPDPAAESPGGAGPPPEWDSADWSEFRQRPTPALRASLFSMHAEFARQIARRHFLDRKRGDIELPDLYQMAYAGLLEAIDRYDPERGAPFRGYAGRRITGSVLDGLSKMSEARGQASFRRRTRHERAQSLAGEGDRAGAPPESLDWLSELAIGLALGFMLEDAGFYASDSTADRRPDAYETLAWRENRQRLLAAVASLPEREQAVVRGHYFDDLDFERIGAMLGVGKARVSQLHKVAVDLLRKRIAATGDFRHRR